MVEGGATRTTLVAAVVQVYYYAGFESLPLHCVIQGRIHFTRTIMDASTRVQIENLSAEYIYAAKNFSTSYLQMFLDDAQRIASQLLQLGVSDEMLDEIWYKYN